MDAPTAIRMGAEWHPDVSIRDSALPEHDQYASDFQLAAPSEPGGGSGPLYRHFQWRLPTQLRRRNQQGRLFNPGTFFVRECRQQLWQSPQFSRPPGGLFDRQEYPGAREDDD